LTDAGWIFYMGLAGGGDLFSAVWFILTFGWFAGLAGGFFVLGYVFWACAGLSGGPYSGDWLSLALGFPGLGSVGFLFYR
jgi:hypothetical protein